MLYLRLISVSLRSQLQYRVSFFFDLLGSLFATFLEFVALAAVFGRFGSLGGWGLMEVAFLYGIVETAFGLMDMLFSGFDPAYFSQLIRRGGLDQMLLRPAGLVLQVLGAEFILRRLGRIVQGAAVLGLALTQLDLAWTPPQQLYLPLVILSAVAFFGGLFVTGAATCFWTVEASEAINIFTYGGSTMLTYPMHIYAGWMQRFFTYILPGALVVYHPALYLLGRAPAGPLSFLAPAAGLGVLTAGFGLWFLGLRHYTSTGT